MAQSEGQDPQAVALAEAKATIREMRGLLRDAGRAVQTLRAEVDKASAAAESQVEAHNERLEQVFQAGLVELGDHLAKLCEGSEAAILKKFHTLMTMLTTLPSHLQAPGMNTLEDMVALHVDPENVGPRVVNQMFQPLMPHQMARLAKSQRKARKGRQA